MEDHVGQHAQQRNGQSGDDRDDVGDHLHLERGDRDDHVELLALDVDPIGALGDVGVIEAPHEPREGIGGEHDAPPRRLVQPARVGEGVRMPPVLINGHLLGETARVAHRRDPLLVEPLDAAPGG